VGLVQTVCQSSCSRFVHNTTNFQTGNFTGFFGGLTLRIVEVGGHRDDGFGHFSTEIVFGGFLHFLKNHGGDFLRGVHAAIDVDARCVVFATLNFICSTFDVHSYFVKGFTHEAFDGGDGFGGVGDGLAFGRITDFAFATFNEGDHGRSGAFAFAVSNDDRIVSFHYGNTRVGGSQVNSNNFSHSSF